MFPQWILKVNITLDVFWRRIYYDVNVGLIETILGMQWRHKKEKDISNV